MLGREIKFNATNGGSGTSGEKTHNQKMLMGEIKGAIQEIENNTRNKKKEQERIQYEDRHDDPSRLRD